MKKTTKKPSSKTNKKSVKNFIDLAYQKYGKMLSKLANE